MVALLNGLVLSRALLATQDLSLTNTTAANVRARLLESARASWELGTAAEAITEFAWPALSAFESTAFPPPSHLNRTLNAEDVLQIVSTTVARKPPDSLPLIANQGSAADPASIGVAVLLANWTRSDPSNTTFEKAASEQLDHLLHYVPRSNQGAISHRQNEVQLWADFIYMVPPFIAYYGALEGGNGGRALMQVAYDQCRLYRDALKDSSGLWRHIALGKWQDNAHWATGNAWAAAGMLRVLSTLNHSSDARQFRQQQANISNWIQEIAMASWSHQNRDGSLNNIIDEPKSFSDSSSTALLAAVTYRMSTFTNDTSLIPAADKAFSFVKNNIDDRGWLHGTVDPYKFSVPSLPGSHSPEGQAFVLLLQAAYTAWKKSTLN